MAQLPVAKTVLQVLPEPLSVQEAGGVCEVRMKFVGEATTKTSNILITPKGRIIALGP